MFYEESHGKGKGWWVQIADGEIPNRLQKKTRTAGQWNHLPREAVNSPALGSFSTQTERVLGHLISTRVWSRWVGADNPWGPFQPGILWFCALAWSPTESTVPELLKHKFLLTAENPPGTPKGDRAKKWKELGWQVSLDWNSEDLFSFLAVTDIFGMIQSFCGCSPQV